jgi:hypothetical protein
MRWEKEREVVGIGGMCSVQFCVFVWLERERKVGVGKVCVLNFALQDMSLVEQKKEHQGLLLNFDEYWSSIYRRFQE